MQNIISETRIGKLLIHETGTYNPQYRRPYETNADGNIIAMIQERVHGSGQVSASNLSGIAYQFIAPTADVEKKLEIVNGWTTRRFRFLMEVITRSAMSVETTEVVMGYTDHVGLTLHRTIDPEMIFFVNSVINMKRTTGVGAFGNSNLQIAGESAHILAENNWGGVFSEGKDYRMRPTDVFSVMSRAHLGSDLGASVIDSRNLMTSAPQKSRRANGLAANFAASLFSNYSAAVSENDMHQSSDQILTDARGNAAEQSCHNDPFLRAIGNIRNSPTTNFFTFGDLKRLDPNVERDEITAVVLSSDAQQVRSGMHETGQSDDIGHTSLLAQFATVLGQAVPALMMDVALTKIGFSFTNQTHDRRMAVELGPYASFSAGLDSTRQLKSLMNDLEIKVMRDLSQNDMIGYQVKMKVSLTSESTIEISIDGVENGNWRRYVIPTFCDALFVPVVTSSNDRSIRMAADFSNIFRNTIDAANQSDPAAGGGCFGVL